MTTQNIFDLVDTWNDGATTFTAVKMNVTDTASNAASLLMDLQVGTVSKFKVSKAGGITTPQLSNTADQSSIAGTIFGTDGNGPTLSSASQLSLRTNGSSTALYLSSAGVGIQGSDLYLTRRAAANLRLGAADTTGTTAPTAQFLSAQSWLSSTTNNQTGANFTIDGSQGTGTGAGGSIIFRVAPAGGTSNGVQNALATALTIGSDRVVTVAANASSLAQIAMADRGTVLSIYATAFGVQSLLVSAPGGLTVYNDTGSLALGAASDVKLFRDDANKLALRNSTAAQTFNLYGTYTDGSNYERLSFTSSGGNVDISTEKAGTGVVRPIRLFTTGSAALQFGTVNVLRWNIDTSGHFVANADNTYDIGASGATRPRNVYIGGSIVVGDGGRISRQSAFGGIVFQSSNSVELGPGTGGTFATGATSAIRIVQPLTVATLPTPSTGMMARVTDATAPVIGATVAGSGAAQALVWYNGANWTVIGV